MALVFGHRGPDLGPVPNRVAEGWGSVPGSLGWHRRQVGGASDITVSQSSVGRQDRSALACPGGRPGGFPDRVLGATGLAWGCCVRGGSEEFAGVERAAASGASR